MIIVFKCCAPVTVGMSVSRKMGQNENYRYLSSPTVKGNQREELSGSCLMDPWTGDADDPRIRELHFQEVDFIRQSNDSNNRRKRKKGNCGGNLERKRLKKDAVPSIWPGSPTYLS